MRCQRQILDVCWWAHVSNAEVLQRPVCQSSVTSYVIDAYLCLAMLHAWTLEYQHRMNALHLQRFRRMPTLYCYVSSGDLRSPGVMEGHNGSLGLRDDDDDDDDDDKTCVKIVG